MSFLSPTDRTALQQDPEKAGQAMESMLLQRMLASCHLMGKENSPGAGMRSELFVETLADAVTKSGGLGIAAKQITPKAPGEPMRLMQSLPEKNATSANTLLPLKSNTSGVDLETELLSHRTSLIGNVKRTEDNLGEPQNR